MITDSYVESILLWHRDAVPWLPLCSHLPLQEPIRGNLSATCEELELAAAIRQARRKEKGNIKSREHRAKKRNESLVDYRAKVTEQKMAWSEKNPNKVLKIAAKVRNKAKDEQRFFCDDCQLPLATQSALDKHYKTQAHLDRAAGIEKTPITRSAVTVKAVRQKAKDNKLHYCAVCDKSFNNDWSLQRHLGTPLHAKRLAKSTANT